MLSRRRLAIAAVIGILIAALCYMLFVVYRPRHVYRTMLATTLCGHTVTVTLDIYWHRTFSLATRIHGSIFIDDIEFVSALDAAHPNSRGLDFTTADGGIRFFPLDVVPITNENWLYAISRRGLNVHYDNLRFDTVIFEVLCWQHDGYRVFYFAPAATVDEAVALSYRWD